jgi:hypothetical protein
VGLVKEYVTKKKSSFVGHVSRLRAALPGWTTGCRQEIGYVQHDSLLLINSSQLKRDLPDLKKPRLNPAVRTAWQRLEAPNPTVDQVIADVMDLIAPVITVAKP